MDKFNEICKKIKQIKIQGAENIAIAALKAYSLNQNKQAIKKLISLRPTEPALVNALKYAEKYSTKKALEHFKNSRKKIINFGIKKINSTVFTHCHSSTVIQTLIKAKKQGKKFEVFNTETRPLYQGRRTSKELAKAGIKVTEVVDSAAEIFLKKSKVFFLGADAVLKDGSVINKIGSGMLTEIAYNHKIPVYILTDSWKFSNKPIKIEERSYKEVWEQAPKNIKVKNLVFEKIEPKYITAIISEFGILKPKEFVKKVK